MKKYLLLIFTMFFLVALTSCDINKYEENTWYSNDRLKECLVEDLPEIQNVDYVKKNDEDVYFYMNSNDYNSYVNIVYNYLKSQNFEYLGTKGDDKASLAGMLSTYYFKEANTLEEFRTDGDGSDYTFVYSDGTLDGSRIVFNIIKFYRDDNSTLEYKNKEFNYNTFMVVRHYSESPLGGIPMLKDEEIEDEIINAYVEKYELLETPTIGQLFNSFVKDGKEVVPFIMGEYGDAMVWSETVANIYFYYPDHRRIEVYYDNAIYTLKEAYDQGILTQQNLIDIAKEDDYDCKMGHSWDEGELTQIPGGGEIMLYTCVNNTKGGKKCCERSKAIPEEVLEGAFIDAYNHLSKNKKVCFDKLYESIKSNLKDEDLASLIGKNERKLSSLELKKKNLVDLKLSDVIDEKTYKDAFDDIVGRINAVNADLEMLKADKEAFDSKAEKIKQIEAVIKEGNEITTFDRYLFEVTVERVVVGEENDPYKIKFFLKTKQVYEVNAMEYILKKKRGTLINGISYQHKADDVGHQPLVKSPDTCGNSCVAQSQKRLNA